MRAFVENRIKPYYLHHGDLAPGTAHLRTGIEEGQALMRALHGRMSGLCQPTYVLDIPGGHGKSPVGPSYLERAAEGAAGYTIEDFKGGRHVYPPPPAATRRCKRRGMPAFTARAMIISFAGRQSGVPPHAVLQFQP